MVDCSPGLPVFLTSILSSMGMKFECIYCRLNAFSSRRTVPTFVSFQPPASCVIERTFAILPSSRKVMTTRGGRRSNCRSCSAGLPRRRTGAAMCTGVREPSRCRMPVAKALKMHVAIASLTSTAKVRNGTSPRHASRRLTHGILARSVRYLAEEPLTNYLFVPLAHRGCSRRD